MNWYKKSQTEFNEPPKWEYPGADHDYNPSWDYDVEVSPDKKIVDYINNYINKVKQNILPQIGFIKDIKAAFIKGEMNTLARYVDGTRTHAVIIINIEAIKEGVKDYGVHLEDQLEITILHELAHAIQDASGLGFDEDEAEDFADDYQFSGVLNKFWENKNY